LVPLAAAVSVVDVPELIVLPCGCVVIAGVLQIVMVAALLVTGEPHDALTTT
jgi:hypothetical protein